MKPEEVLIQLTLKEKISLCEGADFWHTADLSRYGFPSLMMCDGPHGLRCQKKGADMLGMNKSEPATCFPTSSITACSWDVHLIGEISLAIAKEALANNVSLLLGPGANIKRDPLCGRNFEYFSEDPFLSGSLAAAFIREAQAAGVDVSLKHFALNNQEYKRLNGDSQADERTMREIYLASFEKAVREGRPATVMCAYNKINGIHCSDNPWLLTDVLRKDWGFNGMVLTDWGALNDRVRAFRAGCDLCMPGGSAYMEKEVENAVQDGRLSVEQIDQCAMRVLRWMDRANRARTQMGKIYDVEAHHALARRAAEESAVLLKNEAHILPLAEGRKVALLGQMASMPRFQGTGSSHINPTKCISAKDAMPDAAFAAGYLEDGSTTQELIAEAINKAKAAEVAIVFAGLPERYESEGFDRVDLKMPKGHLQLIEAVTQANPNTVVVLCCGCVVECPWADDVKGILYLGLSGQAGGEAAANLLYGRVNPCGKLAESWPLRYEDSPTANCYRNLKNAQYREGIYVGYRYYDKAEIPLRWAFGYGLSYTSFAYRDLEVSEGNVSVIVKNTGDVAGAEIVQLYILPPEGGIYRPRKELKGFAKVFLNPGEEKSVAFQLDERAFSIWNHGWKKVGGAYRVAVGTSSQNLLLSALLQVEGEATPPYSWQIGSWYAMPKGTPSLVEWKKMYGVPLAGLSFKRGQYTMDNTILEMKQDVRLMRFLYWAIETFLKIKFGGKRKSLSNPQFKMFLCSSPDAPLRSLQINSRIKGDFFQGLLEFANGHPWKGIVCMFKKG